MPTNATGSETATEESTVERLVPGRFLRIAILIAVVTAVFLFVASHRLEGLALRLGTVAIGAVALITVYTGFLIAGSRIYEQQSQAVDTE